MQQAAVFWQSGFDDFLQGISAFLLLQLLPVLRGQVLALPEHLLTGLGTGPQITGSAASSNAYTKMQIDNMYAFSLNSCATLTTPK
jgi:hypothetical protein